MDEVAAAAHGADGRVGEDGRPHARALHFFPSLLCFSRWRGGGGERSVVLVVGIVAVQPRPPANAEQARATGDGGGEFGRSAVEAEAERVLGSPQPLPKLGRQSPLARSSSSADTVAALRCSHHARAADSTSTHHCRLVQPLREHKHESPGTVQRHQGNHGVRAKEAQHVASTGSRCGSTRLFGKNTVSGTWPVDESKGASRTKVRAGESPGKETLEAAPQARKRDYSLFVNIYFIFTNMSNTGDKEKETPINTN
uniref:Uncharacterized protein n=1 Tax=Oryza sativa subsp. japonica TaxID=39947 RepID=Q6YYN3_ORYSJ|nr:hypothetical protein [Oryza sativa Japonica Group]